MWTASLSGWLAGIFSLWEDYFRLQKGNNFGPRSSFLGSQFLRQALKQKTLHFCCRNAAKTIFAFLLAMSRKSQHTHFGDKMLVKFAGKYKPQVVQPWFQECQHLSPPRFLRKILPGNRICSRYQFHIACKWYLGSSITFLPPFLSPWYHYFQSEQTFWKQPSM